MVRGRNGRSPLTSAIFQVYVELCYVMLRVVLLHTSLVFLQIPACFYNSTWHADAHFIPCSWVKCSWADGMMQVAKNEMWPSEVCFACLTWLYGLFVRMLIVHMSSKTFARAQSSGVPLKERSRVKLRRLTREHISKNIPKTSKIHDHIPVE